MAGESAPKMPLSLKARGGRLSMFARSNSVPSSQANGRLSDVKHEPTARAGSESVETLVPTREQLVEQEQIAVPIRGRGTEPASHQGYPPDLQRPQSPSESSSYEEAVTARMEFDRGREDLFAGSQLGESFMHSGLSTPQNETVELDYDAMVEAEKVPPFEYGKSRRHVGSGSRRREDGSFHIGHDGFVSLPTDTSRRDPAQMKDGFLQEVSHNRHGSTSPGERHTKLPLREVKLRRPHSQQQSHHHRGQKDRERHHLSSKSTSEAKQERTHADEIHASSVYYDFDENLDSSGADEPQVTPKAKVKRGVPQLSLVKGSMSPTRSSLAGSSTSKGLKRRRPSPDYDDKALSSMSFEQLQNQPFDYNPTTADPPHNGAAVSGEEALTAKLEHFRHLGESEQKDMFAGMSMGDWEASGEWLVDQFAELMRKMRNARQAKRRMVQGFEDEAAAREEAVRVRSEMIESKLAKMKEDGQRVVGGLTR